MTESTIYSFGEWLKNRREKLRMTQRELAMGIHCSVAMIKKIESDERHASPELAELLAAKLSVPPADVPRFVEVARGERPVDFLTQRQDQTENLPQPALETATALPKPATPFIGRSDEMASINERLANPDCRLLTLLGPGGMGKTRLAIAAAQRQVDVKNFADGVTFVPLASITDAALVANAIATSLQLTLTGTASEQVQAYLRRRNMLLVLDNCEQLDGDLTWLSDLLASAPGIKLLATSRERLQLEEEWVYVVPELAQSATLFVDTARRVKQDFDFEREKIDIMYICQLVENLPLAVELAAGWTTILSCAQIADHIHRDIHILATDVHNVPERHRSVQAVFDHSWKLLSLDEQNALMRLSIFRGGWQAEEVEKVAGANLLMLRRLVGKSLVRVGENGRYDLHELIRQYAAEKLAQSGVEAETRQRHFDAYLALAAQLDAQQFTPRQGLEALTRFDCEQGNIHAALTWGLDNSQTEPCLRFLTHLYAYWLRRGTYYEGGQLTIRAIEQAGALESADLCAALSLGSTLLGLQGRYREADPLAFKVLPMAHRLEEAEALIVGYLSYAYGGVSTEDALRGLHQGIDLIEKTGKWQQLLPVFYILTGTWFQSSGRYAEAGDYYRKGLAIYRQMGAVDMMADPLGRLGQLALQEGRLQEAYDLTIESAQVARSMGRQVGYAEWGGARLGLIQLYLGEIEAAEDSLEEALLVFEDVSRDARWQQEVLIYLSEVALARGDVNRAVERLEASLKICRNLYQELQATRKLEGSPEALPIEMVGLHARAALVAAAQGQYERAVTLYSIAELFRAQSGQVIIPPLQSNLDKTMKISRIHLSEDAYQSAWEMGQAMSLSAALEFLLAEHSYLC